MINVPPEISIKTVQELNWLIDRAIEEFSSSKDFAETGIEVELTDLNWNHYYQILLNSNSDVKEVNDPNCDRLYLIYRDIKFYRGLGLRRRRTCEDS